MEHALAHEGPFNEISHRVPSAPQRLPKALRSRGGRRCFDGLLGQDGRVEQAKRPAN
jgi:hypothetical protein